MRTLARLGALVLLATPGVLLGTAGVAAAALAHPAATAAKPAVLQSAWFWQTAAEQANSPVARPAAPPTEPSGVPKGDLAVADTSNDGSSSKLTTLAFRIGALTPGTTVDSFTVALTLDTSSSATNLNSSGASVVACLPTRLWPTGEGVDYTNAPSVDCRGKVSPSIKGNVWTFTIPTIAQSWVDDQNVGVAFVNDPANTTKPFQVVFTGAKTVKATMTYTPAVTVPTSTGTGSGKGAGSTGSTSTGGGTGGSTGGSSTQPAGSPGGVTISVPPPSGPTTTTANSGSVQPPVVAGGTTPAAPAAATHPATAPSAPSGMFWLGGGALALLIICAAIVLRDPDVPVPTAATTRLGQVLRDREREREHARRGDPDAVPTLAPRRA